jgi:type I restriction enzyme S subunit
MAGEWRICTVDQIKAGGDRSIAIGPFGSRMKADRYVAHGVPVIRGNNISDTRALVGDFAHVSDETAEELRSCNVYAGDLVFPHRGSIGQVGIVPSGKASRYMLSTSLMKLTCNQDLVDPFFVFYFFRSQQGRHALLQNASTVGTPGIGQPLATLRVIPVPVPPLPEQRAIAHILGTLDDKIELNRRMNETLEAMARALFKSWFVDFDPVRAKAEGRDPGLPKPLADLFPARLVDSELGEIPEGWEVQTLEEFVSLNPETWSRDTRPDVIRYVDLSNTKWGRFETVTTYSQQDAPSRAQRVLRSSDTIVGTVRPGNGSYAFIAEDGLTGSTGFAVLRPRRTEYAEFVFLAATARENIEALSHLADGGAYPAVRSEVVAATRATKASDELMKRFSRAVGPLISMTAAHDRESRTLATLRDTLLPKLISGDLRVKDAERFVGRVT